MNRKTRFRAALVIGVLAVAGVIAGLLATRSSSAGSDASGRMVVKKAHNAKLGKTILVTRSGLTLYSLSAERRAKALAIRGFQWTRRGNESRIDFVENDSGNLPVATRDAKRADRGLKKGANLLRAAGEILGFRLGRLNGY